MLVSSVVFSGFLFLMMTVKDSYHPDLTLPVGTVRRHLDIGQLNGPMIPQQLYFYISPFASSRICLTMQYHTAECSVELSGSAFQDTCACRGPFAGLESGDHGP